MLTCQFEVFDPTLPTPRGAIGALRRCGARATHARDSDETTLCEVHADFVGDCFALPSRWRDDATNAPDGTIARDGDGDVILEPSDDDGGLR